jgi:hypothetical protein
MALQTPADKLYPKAQAEQVNTPAMVADPLEQLVLAAGIGTH